MPQDKDLLGLRSAELLATTGTELLKKILLPELQPGQSPDYSRKSITINVVSVFGILFALFDAWESIRDVHLDRLIVDGVVFFGLLFVLLLLRFPKRIHLTSFLVTIGMGLTIVFNFYRGDLTYDGNIWAYGYPAVCFFLIGRRYGAWIFLGSILLTVPGGFIPKIAWMDTSYTGSFLYSYYSALALIGAITYTLEYSREMATRLVLEKQQTLEKTLEELALTEEKMRQMAYHDSLTKLPNRALLREHLEAAINRAERFKMNIAVLYIDFDHFKNINDTLGHEAGDEALKLMVERLNKTIRKSDILARHGGDEFIVLIPRDGNHEEAKELAGRIVAAFQDPIMVGGLNHYLTASIGIVVFPDHADSGEDMLLKSDKAMYQAKESGKNQYVVFQKQS